MNISKSTAWTIAALLSAFPDAVADSVCDWGRKFYKAIGSAFGQDFDDSITPWIREPLECADNGTRKMTWVKPIQSSGSTCGEIALLYWLATWSAGDIQYNWPNDIAADDRWREQMEKKMLACEPVIKRTSQDRFKWTNGKVIFPHCNFIMQGIHTARAVASRNIRGQVNEELHDEDGWIPGRLEQAYGRCTTYWNSVIFNISNAGVVGGQLHQAFLAGTQQHWEVKCPGCGRFHRMRMQFSENEPELGGLRYDTGTARKGDGDVDYEILKRTIRYQMPCGYQVRDNSRERRELSLSGRYSEPENKSAPLTDRSYTLQAVSVDYIDWIDLVRQKQLAFRAKKLGKPDQWLDYLRERECQFIGVEDRRPPSRPLVLSDRKKDREGLAGRLYRLSFWDYQSGKKEMGETPHWWGIVQDFDAAGNSLIVWEGKAGSEGELNDVVNRHGVKPMCVGLDGSFAGEGEDRYVYAFALRMGYNCIKVHGVKNFDHGGVKKIFSEPEELWPRVPNQPGPVKSDPEEEPLFWNLSQSGAMDALAFMRGRPGYEIPGDVSSDFLAHFKAWTLEEVRVPATNQLELRWKKSSERAPDHLYMAAAYLAAWSELLEIIAPEKKQ